MTSLTGKISDKLRALFTNDQILNNPRQPDDKPMPKKGVQGIELSDGKRTYKKK